MLSDSHVKGPLKKDEKRSKRILRSRTVLKTVIHNVCLNVCHILGYS